MGIVGDCCADTRLRGLPWLGRCSGGAENTPAVIVFLQRRTRRCFDIKNMERSVDRDSWAVFARIEQKLAARGYCRAVRRPRFGAERAQKRPTDRHISTTRSMSWYSELPAIRPKASSDPLLELHHNVGTESAACTNVEVPFFQTCVCLYCLISGPSSCPHLQDERVLAQTQ